MKFKILVLLVILFCTLDARTSQRDYLHGDLDMYRFFRGYDWIVNNPKSFTDFRAKINENILPHSIDHIVFFQKGKRSK